MDPDKIPEYLSALADRDRSDLSPEEIDALQHLVREHPAFFDEYRLTIATKLCLATRAKRSCCPERTRESIRALISRLYESGDPPA